jgi:hypothetical protein
MKTHARRTLSLVVGAALCSQTFAVAQTRPAPSSWTPPHTAWGHPDLSGTYTNKDQANTPLERPDELKGRRAEDFSAADLEKLSTERQAFAAKIAGGIGGAETGAGPTHWYDHYKGQSTRPWFLTAPADGRLPAMTPQALTREAAYAALNAARNGEGRADSWLDRSLYDRCITRGLPGSMMPAIYGNSYQIVQAPDSVAIRYEMIHETRVIPLDGRPHVGQEIRQYLGDARAHWEGTTLVVEATNFTNKTHMGYNNRYNGERYRLTERFTPMGPDRLQWQATIEDPDTWTKPWTFTMPLTKDDSQQVFEYGCHEGNLGLDHILSAARAEDRAASGRR